MRNHAENFQDSHTEIVSLHCFKNVLKNYQPIRISTHHYHVFQPFYSLYLVCKTKDLILVQAWVMPR